MTTEGETIGGKWKLCPACHLRVWLTKRGKMCKHIGEPSEHGLVGGTHGRTSD